MKLFSSVNKSEITAMKQFLSIVTQYFGKIVGNEYAKVYLKVKNVDRRLSLKHISLGTKVLDVGGGLGLDALLFAYKGAYPTVLDLSPTTLKLGKSLCTRTSLSSKINYLVADALKLPFKDNSFDIVCSFSAIEHLQNKHEAKLWIREMVRVLKNNGRFILTTSNKYWLMYPMAKLLVTLKIRSPELFFTPEELVAELKENGIILETFDAGVIYYRGYSLIPFNKVNEALEKLLSYFEKFRCFKIICGRMGFQGVKKGWDDDANTN